VSDPGLADFPSLARIVDAQKQAWPEHAKYLRARFAGDDPAALGRTDDIARLVLALSGDALPRYCGDYRWMCENFIQEEAFFRRHNRYRRTRFDQVERDIYSNRPYMARYVNGILLSQLLWRNHAAALDLFRTRFLPTLPDGYSHLEVGPGHGLFLAHAAADPRCRAATGWDVSAASIAATEAALRAFAVARPVMLTVQDVLGAPADPKAFDSAVISEVLEHLEDPAAALRTLLASLKPGGRIFVNAPVNSPAPDHILLWRDPAEITALIESIGFAIDEVHLLPMTGYTVARAMEMAASLSCVVFARRL
jgi:SAM-dependent methyltransferase